MRRLTMLLLATLALTGCIGSVSRSDFEAEIQSRGGGLNASLLEVAIDDVARRVGTADFQVMTLNASPESAVVSMLVRDPANPRNIDTYTYRNGKLTNTEPVRVGADEDLDANAIDVQGLAVDEIDEMVDAALTAYDVEGGYVSSISIGHLPDPDQPGERIVGFSIYLESSRSTANASFTADGDLLAVDLS